MSRTNYPQLAAITDPDNLAEAWRRVAAKKAAAGWDGKSVADFQTQAEAELDRLREELLTGRYVPQPLLQIAIPKTKNPQEERLLALPSVRDKVAQEAVRRVLEPKLDRVFLNNSYGYRLGKGPRKAVRRACHILQTQRPDWVVSLDIDEFFPSVDHLILLDQLRNLGIEEPVCQVLLLWLKMGQVKASGRWLDVYSGVSQGGIVSPLLANVYLHTLDIFLQKKGVEFVRYADDVRLFVATRRQAETAWEAVRDLLKSELKLRLNDLEEPVKATNGGFTFLGLRFLGGKLGIDPAKWQTISQKIAFLAQRLAADQSPATIQHLNESFKGWQRYYGNLVDETETAAREQFWQEVKIAAQKAASEPARKERIVRRIKTTVCRAKRRHIRRLLQGAKVVINTPGVFLGKRGNRLIVRLERQTLYEALLDGLESITLLSQGNSLSADLITYCASREIPICWISAQGQVEAFIYSPAAVATTACQSRQLAASQDPKQAFWDRVQVLLADVAAFPGRIRQGAKDLVNCLLNYGYAVLYAQVFQGILQVGLNPSLGFLHAPRPGTATLAFDIMEIFRPAMVDRVILSELRRYPQEYLLDADSRLTLETRKRLIQRLQTRLATIETFRGQEMKGEEIVLKQIKEIRHHLEGKTRFRPYLTKW